MTILIGLCGRARSGKDTAANALINKHDFDRYSFADPVKKSAQQMFGLSEEETWLDELKDEVNDFWGITHREMFQKIGTEGAREVFFDDIWIRRASKEVIDRYGSFRANFKLVIPDVRFDNEADWIHAMGGSLVHIERPDLKQIEHAKHASENSLDYSKADHVVSNDGTIEELESKMSKTLDAIGLQGILRVTENAG